MSPIGTSRKSRDVRSSAAIGGRAGIGFYEYTALAKRVHVKDQDRSAIDIDKD
jgi:hypothetical protein